MTDETDTIPDGLKPILEAVDRVEHAMEEESKAIRGALSSLRSTVLEHYHALQSRMDGHAKRLQRIEDRLSLPTMDPDG